MATTKKATKTATNKKKAATDAAAWRKNRGRELELPSGNVALVRNPGMDMFLKAGIIPDSLTGLVRQAIHHGKDVDFVDAIKDEEDLNDIFEMFDRILVHSVIEPQVKMPPVNDEGEVVPLEDRDQDVLYADEVDFDDKQFIFQFAVGGTSDLSTFRQQQEEMLGNVLSGKTLEGKAK